MAGKELGLSTGSALNLSESNRSHGIRQETKVCCFCLDQLFVVIQTGRLENTTIYTINSNPL